MDKDFLYSTFDWLHAHPELAMQERATSAFLADKLESFGYQVIRHVGGTTGVIGILDSGAPGKTVALRADMDALPYVIDGQDVARHTCGHDSHCAMALTAAKEIASRGLASGRLMIVFQPAEETLNGAKTMIASGLLDDVDEMIGMHIRPREELKYGQIVCGLRHGASYMVHLKFVGVSAHGARPQQGVNAIEAAMSAVQAIYAIHIDPRISHSIKVTQFHGGGTAANVIPDKAEVTLDIRCQTNAGYEVIADRIRRILAGISEAYGVQAEADLDSGVPAAEYDEDMLRDLSAVAAELAGAANAVPSFTTPGGEDFHFYTKLLPHCKAAYLGLGAEAYPGLHHKDMQFIHEAMELGAEIEIEALKQRLRGLH